MRILHYGKRDFDLAGVTDAAARSGCPAVSLKAVGKRYSEDPADPGCQITG